MPISEQLTAENPEDLADLLQASFMLEMAEEILGLVRTAGTAAQAIDRFREQWPHINKAWDKVTTSRHRSVAQFAIEFLRKTAPILVILGDRGALKERAETAEVIAQGLEDIPLKAAVAYFSAVALMQFREYNMALPLLERANAELPPNFKDPTRLDVLTALGATYVGLGRDVEAEKAFEELSLLTFLKYFSINPNLELEELKALSHEQMQSGTGIVGLLTRPPNVLTSVSVLNGPPAFFRRA